MFARLHPLTILKFISGNAALAVLFILWLRIPDSHTWEVIITILGALILAAASLTLNADTLRRLRLPADPIRRWLSPLILILWLVLFHVGEYASALIDANIERRSGYWNSQLSPHLRNHLTYERLNLWQHELVTALMWWIVPTLLLPFIVETTARGLRGCPLATAIRTLTRWQLWLTTAIAADLIRWLTAKLTNWQPGHTPRQEILSVALRVSTAYLLDALLLALTLTITAALLSGTWNRNHPEREST